MSVKFKSDFLLPAFGAIAIACVVIPVHANEDILSFDDKHRACLERITQDADAAYEDAMIWRDDGGGRRAKHCEAMALFALGQQEEAAYRLHKLAMAPDGGSQDMRADYFAEAANFWLVADNPEEAYRSATDGLKLKEDHIDLRIARARAYAILGRFDYAEIDLTSVLVFDPVHVDALRYRADARRRLGKLSDAKTDIEKAMDIGPISVETAVVRGEINEALRKAALK